MKHLVLGGVKSGKSRFAEQLAKEWSKYGGEVIYIATATGHDTEFSLRVMQHQEQRPKEWQTVEEPLAIDQIINTASGQNQCLLIECLTLWMSNLLEDETSLKQHIDDLCDAVEAYQGEIILVSNETGLGIMPMNAMARRFGDEVGVLHQRLAALCDQVVLTVVGLPHYLKGQC